MAYQPRPYVRERYEQNSRLSDLLMQQGRNAANAQRQQGDISAQMWGNVGNTINNVIGQYAQGKEQEAERKARAAADAPRVEMEALKLREAQQKEGDRGTFDQAMKQPGGRAATLKALEAQPELYQRAQQHFTAMDDTLKRVWGTAAAGVRAFGDQPEAAIAALDDLVEQGFDAKRLDRFRMQIVEHPESVSQIVDQLLAESPEPAHRAMIQKPAVPEVSSVNPEHDVIDKRTGKLIRPGTPKPVVPPTPPNPTEASLAMLAAKGDPAAAKALALIRQQRPPDKPTQPDYEWVTRGDKPVQIQKGTAQPGDMPYRPPSGTSETAQDRQRTARMEAAQGFLTRLNELRDKINTKMGPAAGITGTVRRGVANIGWDPDVAEYERIRAAGGRSLAVAIMGAQNLSDADAEAWANMLPGATVDKETAKRLTDQVGRMLSTMDEPPKPTAAAARPQSTLGVNSTQIVEQNGVRYKVTTDASGKVISSEVAR